MGPCDPPPTGGRAARRWLPRQDRGSLARFRDCGSVAVDRAVGCTEPNGTVAGPDPASLRRSHATRPRSRRVPCAGASHASADRCDAGRTDGGRVGCAQCFLVVILTAERMHGGGDRFPIGGRGGAYVSGKHGRGRRCYGARARTPSRNLSYAAPRSNVTWPSANKMLPPSPSWLDFGSYINTSPAS